MFILLCTITAPARAQDFAYGSDQTRFWFNSGAGRSAGDGYSGFSTVFSGHYATGSGNLGVRLFLSEETGSQEDFLSRNNSLNRARELALMWGYDTNRSTINLSAAAGVGGIWGERNVRGGTVDFSGISVPVEAQVMFKPVSFLGVGAILSVSVNGELTLMTGLLGIQVGNF